MSHFFGLLSVMGWVWAAVALSAVGAVVYWRKRRDDLKTNPSTVNLQETTGNGG